MDSYLRLFALLGLFGFCVWVTNGDFMETVLLYISGVLSAIFINMNVDYN